MTRFRPCIDLHDGRVKQIVGGTLTDSGRSLQTNFVSEKSAGWFAGLYRRDRLQGGHVVKLGPGNDEAAREALQAYPGGLQIGGGISLENSQTWLDAGASHVIVTSWVFTNEQLDETKIRALAQAVGPSRLVLDLSCRRRGGEWVVAMNRWQTLTDTLLNKDTLSRLAPFCAEFLIHAADVEGQCRGIDEELVEKLGQWGGIRPITYAGGARSLEDLQLVHSLSNGKVDLTIGSALDIFGGQGAAYKDCVSFNNNSRE